MTEPTEGERRPCRISGCGGTQQFSARSDRPGPQAGIGTEGGAVMWVPDRQPGWACDFDRDHWQPPDST